MFFVVNPVGNKAAQTQQKNINFKHLFTTTLNENTTIEDSEDYSGWDFKDSQTHLELTPCLKSIDQKLAEYKQKFKGATIVTLQSDLTPEKLQFIGLPTLINDFPVIKTPQIHTDNDYPALDWIRFAAKNMTLRLLEMNPTLRERINYSRYSFIPVCNLEGDAPLFIIDTLYSRTLAQSKHLLWYSDSPKPDLGGHEDRDFRLYFQEELENPEVCNKGFYRGYVAEIDLSILAVNTILQSDFLKDFEEASMIATQYKHDANQDGFTKIQNTGEFDTDLDEFVTCAPVFKKLRELINVWLKDVLNNDQYADNLISHLYRWLSSPADSKLYDPLLHRLVHKLMKKNFF